LLNSLLKFVRQISISQLEELESGMHLVIKERVEILCHVGAYGCPVHEKVVGIPIGALYYI